MSEVRWRWRGSSVFSVYPPRESTSLLPRGLCIREHIIISAYPLTRRSTTSPSPPRRISVVGWCPNDVQNVGRVRRTPSGLRIGELRSKAVSSPRKSFANSHRITVSSPTYYVRTFACKVCESVSNLSFSLSLFLPEVSAYRNPVYRQCHSSR